MGSAMTIRQALTDALDQLMADGHGDELVAINLARAIYRLGEIDEVSQRPARMGDGL